jgi:hypothetical protein
VADGVPEAIDGGFGGLAQQRSRDLGIHSESENHEPALERKERRPRRTPGTAAPIELNGGVAVPEYTVKDLLAWSHRLTTAR